MIDIYRDQLIPLTEAPKHIPTREGKRVHRATVFRWALQGLGDTRLETVKCGGKRYTSRQAIATFFSELSHRHRAALLPVAAGMQTPTAQSEIHRRIQEITGQA